MTSVGVTPAHRSGHIDGLLPEDRQGEVSFSTTMSEIDLPEELLCEILSHCLLTSSAEFFRVPSLGTRGEEASVKMRPSILLVSRRWWRVGVPSLYYSLKIREPLHAGLVTELFLRHRTLGLAVSSLRLEGHIDSSTLYDLARLTPNVQSLYIALDHTSNGAACNLARVLPLLSPRRIYLIDMTRFMRLYPFFPWRPSMRPDEAVRTIGHVASSDWPRLVCALRANSNSCSFT